MDSVSAIAIIVEWNATRPGLDHSYDIDPVLVMHFFPGSPQERVMVGCDDPTTVTGSDTAGAWTFAHIEENMPPPTGIFFST